MNEVDLETTLAPRVMTMRIIVIALLNGIFVFTGIAVYTRATGQMPPPEMPLISYLALAFAVPMLLAALFVPPMIEAAAIKKIARNGRANPVGPLLGVFQQRLIIRSALFEGPAFFALIGYMLEGQWPTLVIAGLMAFGIASNFPSVSGVTAWLEERGERVVAERAGL
jgi:hypothetical protein